MANAQFALLRVLAKVLGNILGGGFVGDLIDTSYEVAKDTWESWSKDKDAKMLMDELEAIVRAEGEQLRQDIAILVREVAGDKPPQTQETINSYLNQCPFAIRRSMRRPEDPTGTTIPPELVPRKADDLLHLLPARLARFKQGDHPLPGVDRVLDSLLGVGGFGEVWKAHNPNLSSTQPVALKFCLDPIAARALQNETRMIDRVMMVGKHPGIVQLLNTYLAAENPCLEYEYVEGGDLGGLILSWHASPTTPTPEEAAKVMLRITQIVAAAHKADIVHRDLKPANILTVKGADGAIQFKIADFGIGGIAARRAIQKSTSGSRARMQMSAVQGSYTPLYASPQQRKRVSTDKRDDVYSLGVIWHQLLTGDMDMGSPSGKGWKRKLSEKGMATNLLNLLESCIDEIANERPADACVLAAQLEEALTPKYSSEKSTLGVPNNNRGDSKQKKRYPKPPNPILNLLIIVIGASIFGILYLRDGGSRTTLPTTASVISTSAPQLTLTKATTATTTKKPTATQTTKPTNTLIETLTPTKLPTLTKTATKKPTATQTTKPTNTLTRTSTPTTRPTSTNTRTPRPTSTATPVPCGIGCGIKKSDIEITLLDYKYRTQSNESDIAPIILTLAFENKTSGEVTFMLDLTRISGTDNLGVKYGEYNSAGARWCDNSPVGCIFGPNMDWKQLEEWPVVVKAHSKDAIEVELTIEDIRWQQLKRVDLQTDWVDLTIPSIAYRTSQFAQLSFTWRLAR